MRFLWIIIFIVGLMAGSVSTACGQEKIHYDLQITLERTACFGPCPYYSLTINFDGAVKFTPLGKPGYCGKGDAPKPPLEGSITQDQLRTLLAEFDKIKFYSLRKQYGSAGKSMTSGICPEYWSDSPTATVSIRNNGKHKTVNHYLGCEGTKILDDLGALEDKIDEIVDSKKWTSQYAWGGVPSITNVQLKVESSPAIKPQ
ncbi:MAG TPA: DUF6438 domain-containing protein [Pyrinomonadaceae bacterium]|nr:DUF6438 domain-containing protein [Pyrinomonadaceae bacterium]